MQKKGKVYVGVSGGVDSSVALARLLRAGFDVTAVFIKTWQPDFIPCTWERERLDAMRVSAHIGVPFLTFDAVSAYKNGVADYMIAEYEAGRTPNPDVMCNREVKFGAFLQFALESGATHVATGHYAQVVQRGTSFELHRGTDSQKDQSYFLWTLTHDVLSHILFPVGDSEKTRVRDEAERYGLLTFAKHDSQGICFLGDIDMKQFLSNYITPVLGDVYDDGGKCIGTHEGALFYTLGQRHGFTIAPSIDTTLPYYVVAKDIHANTLTVSHHVRTCTGRHIVLSNVNLLTQDLPEVCEAQFRYRQKPFLVKVEKRDEDCVMLTVLDPSINVPSLGQSCVLYIETRCLGGGIINDIV